MHSSAKNIIELADALEREVEAQREAAKRAISEYKKTIRFGPNNGGTRQMETRRQVQHAVSQYIELSRKLDELRMKTNEGQMSPRTR